MDIERLREFFLWNTLIHSGFLIWSVIMAVYFRRFITQVHKRIFDLDQKTILSIIYGFLGTYKIIFLVFVFVPWIVLTIMLG